jgi:hypothetical protein
MNANTAPTPLSLLLLLRFKHATAYRHCAPGQRPLRWQLKQSRNQCILWGRTTLKTTSTIPKRFISCSENCFAQTTTEPCCSSFNVSTPWSAALPAAPPGIAADAAVQAAGKAAAEQAQLSHDTLPVTHCDIARTGAHQCVHQYPERTAAAYNTLPSRCAYFRRSHDPNY